MFVSTRKNGWLAFWSTLAVAFFVTSLIPAILTHNSGSYLPQSVVTIVIVGSLSVAILTLCVFSYGFEHELPYAEDVLEKHTVYKQCEGDQFVQFKKGYIMNVLSVWPKCDVIERVVVFEGKMPDIFYVSDVKEFGINRLVWREVSPKELEELTKATIRITELCPARFEN